MAIKTLAMTVLLTACVASATMVTWEFPRMGCCHEGIPFADGKTGFLVWGGGDTVNLTVGRGDLWDHRGGYPWTDGQSYTNIISLVGKGDAAALKSLFSVPVPKNWNPDGNPFTDRYNPYMLPLGRVTVRMLGVALARGELDTATGLGKLILDDGREISLAMSKAQGDFGMYKFGAMTDPDGFPAGLQGQWLEDDRLVPWNGDYHFNINVQECYSPAYRGGHFRNLMPLFRMVLSWRPLLRDNAKKFIGIEDGYVLPHVRRSSRLRLHSNMRSSNPYCSTVNGRCPTARTNTGVLRIPTSGA